MLKNVDGLLGPELLYALAAAGHGDTLALVDRNYPSYSAGPRVIRLDGVDVLRAARAILTVLPLDTFVDSPITAMRPVSPSDEAPASHQAIRRLARDAEGRDARMELLERFDFYGQCRESFAVIATSDATPYACFLLRKGVVF